MNNGLRAFRMKRTVYIDAFKDTKFQFIVAMSLYTGLGSNELNTVKIEGDFVVAKNSK